MSNSKAVDVALMTSELLKWTRPQPRQWIATVMDQVIKQGFLEDYLMNHIKQIHKRGDRNLVSNYWTIMVGSGMDKLYITIMEQKIVLSWK